MRTTLDIPDDVLRVAKIAAVERGTTLKELVGAALANELGLNRPSAAKRCRFPVFGSTDTGALKADVARNLDREEDTRHDALAR